MEIVSKTKSDVKSALKHPLALFFFGMLFAAFLFPMVAGALGKLKTSSPTLGKLIPDSFTKAS